MVASGSECTGEGAGVNVCNRFCVGLCRVVTDFRVWLIGFRVEWKLGTALCIVVSLTHSTRVVAGTMVVVLAWQPRLVYSTLYSV